MTQTTKKMGLDRRPVFARGDLARLVRADGVAQWPSRDADVDPRAETLLVPSEARVPLSEQR